MSELDHEPRVKRLEASLEKAIPGASEILGQYYAAWTAGASPAEDPRIAEIKEYLYNYAIKFDWPYKLLHSRPGLMKASGGQLSYEDARPVQQFAKLQAMEAGEDFLHGNVRRLNASIPMRVRNQMRKAILKVLRLYGIETDSKRLGQLGAKKATREDLRAGGYRDKMSPEERSQYLAGETPERLAQWRLVPLPAEPRPSWHQAAWIDGEGPVRLRIADVDGVWTWVGEAETKAERAEPRRRRQVERLAAPDEPFDRLLHDFAQGRLEPGSLADARARAGLDISKVTARYVLTASGDDAIAKRALNNLEYEIWFRDVPHGAVDMHREELARRGVKLSAVNYRQIRLQARRKIERAKVEELAATDTSQRQFEPVDAERPVLPVALEDGLPQPDDGLVHGTDEAADDDDRGVRDNSEEPSDEQRDDERAWEDASYDSFDPRS